MKYFLMASAFALTACSSPEVKVTNQYEVTCPVTIQLAKVDTITGYQYNYYESSLTIYTGKGLQYREYPKTCVVSMINAGGGN
jgi:hypothetical protein